MKLLFRFGEKDDKWNIYATLVSAIYIFIFYITNIKLTSKNLVFLSLLAMYNGDIKAKLTFTLFLNLLLFNKINYKFLIINFLAVLIVDKFKQKDNKIVNKIYNNNLLHDLTKMSYIIWMVLLFFKYFF